MMVRMINAMFGNEMWVAESRVEEYKAAGHKPAASPVEKPAEPEQPEEEAPEKPKKAKTTKKRS